MGKKLDADNNTGNKNVYKAQIDPRLLANKITSGEDVEPVNVNRNDLYAEVRNMAKISKGNDEIMELFPDLEIAKDTLVSNIVGGVNMFNNPTVYTCGEGDLDVTTKTALLAITSRHINKIYGLEDKLQLMTEEALFRSGSYCEIFIPENTLSDMLGSKSLEGVDVESILDTFSTTSPDIEDILISDKMSSINTGISIGVSPSIINRGYLTPFDNLDKINTYDGFDIESANDLMAIKKLFLKSKIDNDVTETINLGTIDESDRVALGMPLILKIPTESIIPITTSYDKSKHIKYILLLDGDGNPLNPDEAEITSGLENATTDEIIKQALSMKVDNNDVSKRLNVPNETVYKLIVDSVLSRLHRGNGYKVSPAMLNTVYYMAFTRYLKGKKCRMVILDPDNVNYLAFNYRNNGTGKSLLEKLGPLMSMRAIMLMTRLNAHIDNTITKFKVVADLDEKDPSYKKTAATIVQAAYSSRSTNMLFGVRDFTTLNKLISRAGIYFQINHSKLPNMRIDFENVNTDKRVPDTDFYDSLKRDSLKVLGLTPENIEDASRDEYAVGLKIKNALFHRRIKTERDKLSRFTTTYVNNVMRNDMMLKSTLRKYIRSNIKWIVSNSTLTAADAEVLKQYNEESLIEFFFIIFADNLKCRLPDEEPMEDNALNDAFKSYKDRLEEYLDAFFSPEALPEEFIGAVGGKLDAIKGAVTNTLLRKWMTDHDYMSEVVSIFDTDDEGVPTNSPAENFVGYLQQVLTSSDVLFDKNLTNILKASKKTVSKFEERLADVEPDEVSNGEDRVEDPGKPDDTGTNPVSNDDVSDV